MENDKYIQVMAMGGFIDPVKDFKDWDNIKNYSVTAYVLRFSPEALDKYLDIFHIEDINSFEKREEYEENYRVKKAEQKPFIKQICDLIGISDDGVTLTNDVSEIFTLTQIKRA